MIEKTVIGEYEVESIHPDVSQEEVDEVLRRLCSLFEREDK